MKSEQRNHSMLTDYYELSMAQSFFDQGIHERTACFDLFFRRVPEKGGYAVMAGVAQVVDYLNQLKFNDEDISYLRDLGQFTEPFLDYLKNLKFSCDVFAIPEGTPLFPHEPILKVKGPLIQAQLIETMLLLCINHQTLIATKAARISRAAEGRAVMEFGARRAQGADASVFGARAAFIGGAAATSCTLAGELFDIPISGTMAHSFVQSFPSEFEAFKAYAESYPDNTILLVDTYDTLNSGIPNAIRVHQEILEPMGKALRGIRIDSGDLAYLSIRGRELLDRAGLTDCKIVASNALDEYIIRDLMRQGARIDLFGVGERLITSSAEPIFGGVYKLSAIEDATGHLSPRMKISSNVEKMTNPGDKTVYRFYDQETGMAMADVICLIDEVIDETKPYEIFDPTQTWKRKTLEHFNVRPLLEPLFEKGRCVYASRSVKDIRLYAQKEAATLWDSVKRFEYPHQYYVDLSQALWDMKQSFLENYAKHMKFDHQ